MQLLSDWGFTSAKNEDFAFSDERSSASITSIKATVIALFQKLKRLGKVFQ